MARADGNDPGRQAGHRRDWSGIVRSRWLVTTLAIVSAASGVTAALWLALSPTTYRTFITDVADLRIAAFVFGAVALGGSVDRRGPGPGVRPPTGWRLQTLRLSIAGVVLGLALLVIGLIGWVTGR